MRARIMRGLRHARSVAWIDLLDLARVRSTWLALVLFPVINVTLIVVLPGVLLQREQHQQDTQIYDIAAQGAPADVEAVTTTLSSARLRFQSSDDARRSALDRTALVGIIVPPGAAADLSTEGQVKLKAYVLSTRSESRLALGRLLSDVERLQISIALERSEARGLPVAAVRPIDTTSVDLADTERGARLDLAGVIPLLLLLPLSGTIGMAGQRISGAKDQRVFEPLLVLPLARRTLLVGKAIAGFALGSVTLPAVAAPLLLGRIVPIGGTGQQVSVPLTTMAAVVGVAMALLVMLVALGLCAGAASRTSAELGSILPFVSFPVILLALSLQFFSDLGTTLPTLVTPLLGPVLVARDIVGGVAQGSDAVVALIATAFWSALLLAGAATLLERDSVIARATSA